MTVKILQGHCLDVLKTMPDESVHCCVTSPPYFGLRDYQVEGQIGLESTPEEYIGKLVEVFREVKRVLRKDGTLWCTIGDSFTSGNRTHRRDPDSKNLAALQTFDRLRTPNGLKPKDLIGIPWLLAFALRADGWYLRCDIVWEKPNCLPESVKDRPTKSHEYILLLSKSEHYYYDADAIKEPHGYNRWSSRRNQDAAVLDACYDGQAGKSSMLRTGQINPFPEGGRNKRSVWTVNTQPYPESHFAVFPEKLIAPCILAGCPARACAKCGAPYHTVFDRTVEPPPDRQNNNPFAHDPLTTHGEGASTLRNVVKTAAAGEIPTCNCNAGTVPGTVLDPFGGSGTTGKVAEDLGRNSIIIELKPEYVEMIERRTAQMGMFAMEAI
jgi:DNA modification methylase